MKTKNGRLLLAVLVALSFGSCKDWGESDPPAGNQVYPKLEKVTKYTFENEAEVDSVYSLFAASGGLMPTLEKDNTLNSKVLDLDSGYCEIRNSLINLKLQTSASLTFWMRQESVVEGIDTIQDLLHPIFSFENEDGTASLKFSANGGLSYNGAGGSYSANSSSEIQTNILKPYVWHYVGVCVAIDGYSVYVDGVEVLNKTVSDFDFAEIVQFVNQATVFYIGDKVGEQLDNLLFDDVTIYRNAITSKEYTVPVIGGDKTVTYYAPIYFNSFDGGVGDCTIQGGGSIKLEGGAFGNVFSNATGGCRTNYLQLPSTVLSQSSETQALSIGVWVNRGNETSSSSYMWSPLFSAYGDASETENTTPMMICQYRGILQVNCNGWSDYTDAQNVNGVNGVYHDATDWLSDGKWHYYMATFTPTTAKVYIDGEIKNEWNLEGTDNTAAGMFSNGAELDYVCLGGNQAWDWADLDPGFYFDDIAIYNQEVSQEQIKSIMNLKTGSVYINTFESGVDNATIVGEGEIKKEAGKHGNVFSNATGGCRTNYLQLPSTVLSQSSETQALSIGVWVNRGNETSSSSYMWSPLFSAYGDASETENTTPMMICQYRGILQVNCNGWSDYTDAQNVNGVNGVYHDATDWLSDGKWHYYMATFTPTTAKVYIDGEIKNEWNLEGTDNTAAGMFSNGAELDYVCLGGNQAWDWADLDPGFYFDDIAIYNKELTQAEIKLILAAGKK